VSCRIVLLTEEPDFVGRAVCAIGVFDGVHAGHQALVRDAVTLAREDGVEAFVITFDRDPDQVVTPQAAAPQLLTLAEKAQLLCAIGADAVLVVPFTENVASLTPSEFLTQILLSAVDPVAVVVGEDFRFGRGAQGTVETLTRFSEPRGFAVVAHALEERDGEPVTSTRIRALVAAGDVEGAARLMGRPHRVTGTVVHGRGEGEGMGVRTANIAPVEFAALPAAGVYAGRVEVDGEVWPAAVLVGPAPTFPQATDVIEAHLIGFEGDVYDAQVAVEFLTRLRDPRKFDGVDELAAAMRSDIEDAARIAATTPPTAAPASSAEEPEGRDGWEVNPFAGLAEAFFDTITMGATESEPELLADGSPVVDDPAALEAAERSVAGLEPVDRYAEFDDTWVQVLGPVSLVAVTGPLTAYEITTPLDARGIPYVWDPFDPQDLTSVRPELMSARRFRLFVPPELADSARDVLDPKWGEPGV